CGGPVARMKRSVIRDWTRHSIGCWGQGTDLNVGQLGAPKLPYASRIVLTAILRQDSSYRRNDERGESRTRGTRLCFTELMNIIDADSLRLAQLIPDSAPSATISRVSPRRGTKMIGNSARLAIAPLAVLLALMPVRAPAQTSHDDVQKFFQSYFET